MENKLIFKYYQWNELQFNDYITLHFNIVTEHLTFLSGSFKKFPLFNICAIYHHHIYRQRHHYYFNISLNLKGLQEENIHLGLTATVPAVPFDH